MDPQSPSQPTVRHQLPPQYSPPSHSGGQGLAQAPSAEDTRQELEHAISGSHEVLCTATTCFPFTLFPDTVTLDRAKLTITHRTFFGAADVMSIRIEDILNVTANIGPILGSIKIVSRVFNIEKPYVVEKFKRNDALRIKHITQGYVIALQREIDCSNLPTPQLAVMLEQLGTDAHDV
jgi:hypothetical protein